MVAISNNPIARVERPSWTFLLRLIFLWFIGVIGIFIVYLLLADVLTPTRQEAMAQTRIYAYRGWQSTGIRLEANETALIRAKGEWLYTPGEWHGADGHSRYPAPSFYPLSGVPGGVLVGRVGENGNPQRVGARGRVNNGIGSGMLYLRINDDILSDNQGVLDITIEVTPAPEYDD